MAQFNSLLVTGNSRFLNPINGNARNGVYQVIGTQTAATGSWTGSIAVPALYDGLTIMYYLPYNGSGNATLNLTLSDGTTTGAINCYYRKTERLTTHFPSGSNIVLTYYSAGSIKYDGTATSDNRWIANANYLDGNDQAYNDRIIYVKAAAGSNKVFPYTLVMRLPDGRWESIVTSASTGTGKARNAHGFLFGQLDWMNYNETYNENSIISEYRLWSRYTNLVDYRYSFNLENNTTNGFTANKSIYLVGTINSDGLFYLDSSKWWTQTLPSSADGKIYLYIGDAYDWYRASFYGTGNFKAFVYTNGHIREYCQEAGTVNGHTVAKDVPSNADFSNTTYTFANGTNGFTVTPSGGSAQTVTVTPSITNNVTGSGTSGYIAKFNGANTITNGPAIGSGTTKYLREDGTWQTPPSSSDTTYTIGTSGNNITLTPSSGSVQSITAPYATSAGSAASATSATSATTASKLGSSNVGSATNPIYLNGGTATACTYSLNKTVPSDAVFTDTTYSSLPAASGGTDVSLVTTGEKYTWNNGCTDTKVTQTETPNTETVNTGYEVLLSDTHADGITHTEGARKTTDIKYIPRYDTGSTTDLAKLYVNGEIHCWGMNYVDVSEYVGATKSSGAWSIVLEETYAYKSGNVIQMIISLKGNGNAVSGPTNSFVGSVLGYPPVGQVTFSGYYNAVAVMGIYSTDGSFSVRPLGSITLSSSNRCRLTATYIYDNL